MKKRTKSWDHYENELFRKGRISEEEIAIAKMKMDFSRILHDLRVSRGLTQKRLAGKIGVRQQTIAKIESGEENLSLETIGKLLIALRSVLHVGVMKKNKTPDEIMRRKAA